MYAQLGDLNIMLPLDIQPYVVNSIEEEKWQRFNEWQERERVMRQPRVSARHRFLRASGQALIAFGERLERSAEVPQPSELQSAC